MDLYFDGGTLIFKKEERYYVIYWTGDKPDAYNPDWLTTKKITLQSLFKYHDHFIHEPVNKKYILQWLREYIKCI